MIIRARTFYIFVSVLMLSCGGGGDSGSELDAGNDVGMTDLTVPVQDMGADEGDSTSPEDVQGDLPTLIDPGPSTDPLNVTVTVLLDEVPTPNVTVRQGGNTESWTTVEDGRVEVIVDRTVPGEHFVMASHPSARIRGDYIFADTTELTISLMSYDASDNEDYIFKDPGVPGESHVIEKCAHCHLTVADTWYESAHRTSAKNPVLHDLYSGTAVAFQDQAACETKGGTWSPGIKPGTGESIMQCVVSTTVQALTEITKPGSNGNCADCHAPGIDGVIGERDLLEAEGYGFEYGVHCEVCHHVESVDLDAGPGVSGSLKILRPSEIAPYPGMGEFFPLTFCPDSDIANLYMGCVQREHFKESSFCAGCHELRQPSFVPGSSVDTERWPDGKIPVHTTFSEWNESSFAGVLSCQGCHMPPADPEVSNSADLQFFGAANTGVSGGWPRAPGSVSKHTWTGPRSPVEDKMNSPYSVSIETNVESGVLDTAVQVTNQSAGHYMPTGEPLRSMIVLVDAHCGEDRLKSTGGDSIPDFGGAVEIKYEGDDLAFWENAEVGMIIHSVSTNSGFHDYDGFGPFGDGTFSAEEKGMPVERVVDSATVISLNEGDGGVGISHALLPADKYYLAHAPSSETNKVASTLAGRSGFGFARVLRSPSGQRMAPHFLANDVASDNRLGPNQSWTSNHVFESSCETPVVTVTLVNRAYPYWLAQERGWPMRDTLSIHTSE